MTALLNAGAARPKFGRVLTGALVSSAFLLIPGHLAGADTVDSVIPSSCSTLIGSVAADIPVTVTDTPDPVVSGGAITVDIDSNLPALTINATVRRAVVTIPVPTQVATVNSVTFTGGNFTPSSQIVQGNLVLTFVGPVELNQADLPEVHIAGTLRTGLEGQTIDWKTFSRVQAQTSLGSANCTPNDPNQIVNRTTVSA